MTTKFRSGTKIQREIRVYGVSAPVIVTIAEEGVSMAVKGARKHASANWRQIAEAMNVPEDAPSFLMGRPIDFLYNQATKRERKSDG
jgi:hypothetical protein